MRNDDQGAAPSVTVVVAVRPARSYVMSTVSPARWVMVRA